MSDNSSSRSRNRRAFLLELTCRACRYLNEHAFATLPDDDDVFESDNSVNFSEIARPAEHKRAIAVNAFVSTLSPTLVTQCLISRRRS
jgi:hypothetical protein